MFLFSISIDISRDFSSTKASCCSRYLLTASFHCKGEPMSHIVKILMDPMQMIILRKLNLHLPQDYLGLFHVLQVLFDLLLPSKQLPLEVTHLHFSVLKKIDKKDKCQIAKSPGLRVPWWDNSVTLLPPIACLPRLGWVQFR